MEYEQVEDIVSELHELLYAGMRVPDSERERGRGRY
jgi:hypothetical protein